MKKWICIILAASNLFAMTACAQENNANGNVMLFEKPSKTQMSLYTEMELELLDNVKDSEIVWETSDSTVLEVSEGMIFAKSQGTATVSARYQGKEQSLEFTVAAAEQTPFVDEAEISLILESEFTVAPYLYVNGIAYDNAEYAVISEDSSIVSVKDGNVLKANDRGETTLSVSASWRGIPNIATATITCKVNGNEGIVPQKKNIVLYDLDKSFRGQSFSNSEELNAEVFLDGKTAENAEIVWESKNEEIAIVSGGRVQARSVGETELTGTYMKANGEEIQTSVTVSVEYARLDFNDDLLIGLNEVNNAIDACVYFGEGYKVEKIEVERLKSEYTVIDNMISGKSFGEATSGEYACRIYCAEEKIYCTATLILADRVIHDAEDLFNAAKYLTAYIALANDIDDIGERTTNIGAPNKYGFPVIGSPGNFTGTFNGMGHTLSDFIINTANAGIFEGADGGAVFKNFAMKNVTFAKTGECTAPLFYRLNGVCFIENVYIEVNDFGTTNSSGGVAAFLYMGGLNVKNCIFVINGLTPQANNGAICGRSFRSSLAMENTYVITEGKLCSTHPDAYNTTSDAVNAYSACLYSSEEEFIAVASNGLLDFSEFNKYWNLNKEIPDMSKIN